MRSVGIDLHKRSLTVCAIDKTTGEIYRRRFNCQDTEGIVRFFRDQAPFEVVVEASATYEWLWELLEPLAVRLVLAHPKKLRIIGECKKKSDRFDAYTLADFLSKDMIPEAHRPTPRQREYQHLVKHRCNLVRHRTRLRTLIRGILANRNLDQPGIFRKDKDWFSGLKLSPAEKFRVLEALDELDFLAQQVDRAAEELAKFRESATPAQKKEHQIVDSVPGVGPIIADVVLSSLGDVKRFSSAKKVASYAGLAPGFRQSDRKRLELHITKEGPRLLRWALVEAAWKAVRTSPYWKGVFETLAHKGKRKKAIVAVARRLLVVIYTLLRKGECYQPQAIRA